MNDCRTKKVNLNKRTVEALPTPSEGRMTYKDTREKFLRLVVPATGRKSWFFLRRVGGRVRYVTIGTYPSTTPDAARRECARIAAEYDAGKDPAAVKREQRSLQTWADLFGWYIENHAKPHKRTWEYDVKMEALYCKAWRRKPWPTVTVQTVTAWHKRIGAENGKHQADRVLAMVKTVFSVAMETGIIPGPNPAARIRKFYSSADEYGRERFLSNDEIGRLLNTLTAWHDPDIADFFLVLLLTGARRGNVQSMRWQDMDRTDPTNPRWLVPGTESKNKEAMSVVLSPVVLDILNRRHEARASDTWVFPSRKANAKTAHLSEPKKAWRKICEQANIENVRIHDLRRTLGSVQARLGASLQIIGKSLGHRSTQSTKIYARLTDEPVAASVNAAVNAMLLTAGKGGRK